jgi:hypothetical protein
VRRLAWSGFWHPRVSPDSRPGRAETGGVSIDRLIDRLIDEMNGSGIAALRMTTWSGANKSAGIFGIEIETTPKVAVRNIGDKKSSRGRTHEAA